MINAKRVEQARLSATKLPLSQGLLLTEPSRLLLCLSGLALAKRLLPNALPTLSCYLARQPEAHQPRVAR